MPEHWMCLSCTSAQVSGSPSDGRGGRDVIKGAPASFAKEKLVDPRWKRDTGSRTNAVCLKGTLSRRLLPVTRSRECIRSMTHSCVRSMEGTGQPGAGDASRRQCPIAPL